MDFHELARKRRSIRRFKPDPLPADVVERIMSTAVWAPSAMNRQTWKFFVTTDEMRDRLATLHQPLFDKMEPSLRERYGEEGVELRRSLYINFSNAPVAVVCFAETGEGSAHMAVVSTALACQNLVLAATQEGIGSLVMGSSINIGDEIAFLCGVETTDHQLVMVILLGYPDETPEPPQRRKKRIINTSSPADIRH